MMKAQHNLAVMYYKGEGTSQNYKEAYVWASVAAAQSNAPKNVAELRDLVAKQLSTKDLIVAQQQAAQLQKKQSVTNSDKL
jgi:TPR repeat protein